MVILFKIESINKILETILQSEARANNSIVFDSLTLKIKLSSVK